ncbi:hypothetical protein ACFXTN_023752 [Malus domestica]
MASPRKSLLSKPEDRQSAAAIAVQPLSPRYPPSGTPTSRAQRRIEIATDLSDESAFAARFAGFGFSWTPALFPSTDVPFILSLHKLSHFPYRWWDRGW